MIPKLIFGFFLLMINVSLAQSCLGKWITIDDKTGEEKSIVLVYEEKGLVYGKVIDIFDEVKRNRICEKCSGSLKNKPVLGMVFMKNLKKDGNEYNDGIVIDPESGKEYSCYIMLENENTLKVRGYLGFSLMGRTQYWKRYKP